VSTLTDEIRAEHQIRLTLLQGKYGCGQLIAMSCTCLAVRKPGGRRPWYEIIEARSRFPAAEAITAWRAWHAERSVIV
jgi:hypothetical protein